MNNVPAHQYLSTAEQKELLKRNDLKAALDVTVHWLWIVGVMLMVHFYTNLFTITIALLILGGKQLGCAILMHDASHKSVFTNKKLNDFVGQYLGAYPIFQDMYKYRTYHLQHHLNTGLEDDPDLLLTRGYPTTRMSMLRKFTRDLIGITGIKALVGVTLMNLGYLKYSLGGEVIKVSQKDRTFKELIKTIWNNFSGPIFTNAVMFGLLFLLGSPWIYILWIAAYLTTFQLVIRIRSIAEHAVVEDPTNPFKNTRTTYANFFERLLFAPYYVNYHAEHHLLMGVPSYNLPKMHKILKQKGFYNEGVLETSYWKVLKLAMGKGIKVEST